MVGGSDGKEQILICRIGNMDFIDIQAVLMILHRLFGIVQVFAMGGDSIKLKRRWLKI